MLKCFLLHHSLLYYSHGRTPSSSLKIQATKCVSLELTSVGQCTRLAAFSGRLSVASQAGSARTVPHLKSCSKSTVGHAPKRVLLGSFPTSGNVVGTCSFRSGSLECGDRPDRGDFTGQLGQMTAVRGM